MESNQLDYNQPFLSVRRSPVGRVAGRKSDGAVPVAPVYRSELRSGSLRRPGTVPFQWEQTPGLPKEVKKQMNLHCDIPLIAPKLPPGRLPQNTPQESLQAVLNGGENAIIQTEIMGFDSLNDLFLEDDSKDYESCEELTEKRTNSDASDSEDSYVDAPDTLSRTESFFINCSDSGFNGGDLKPSERFFIDPQTRELMMDRFLPAAKAMTLETPQYSSKKEAAIIIEQSAQSKKTFTVDNKPLLRYGPSFAKRWSYFPEKEKENEEDSDNDYDLHQNLPAVCGLLPKLCTKNSLCLLNPLPAISKRTRFPKSTGNVIQSRFSSAGSFNQNDNMFKPGFSEPKQVNRVQRDAQDVNSTSLRPEIGSTSACLQFLEEAQINGAHEEKTFQELLADESTHLEELDFRIPVYEKTLYVDTLKKVESAQNKRTSVENHDILRSRREEQMRHINEIDRKQRVSTSNGVNQNARNYSITATNVEVADRTENQTPESSTIENSDPNYSRFPIPPSLPKSPSDSWLGRTLPFLSAKKIHQHSYLGETPNPQNLGSKVPAIVNKCETIDHHLTLLQDSTHSSKGLLTSIPEAEELHS